MAETVLAARFHTQPCGVDRELGIRVGPLISIRFVEDYLCCSLLPKADQVSM